MFLQLISIYFHWIIFTAQGRIKIVCFFSRFENGFESIDDFFKGLNVQEENLMKILFGQHSQYNALVTPIHNASEPLYIYFGLTLMQIINVYEKEQIVKVNVWLQLRWYDYQMKWNPDRFGWFHWFFSSFSWKKQKKRNSSNSGRLESIRVTPDKVWTPDLVLFK